MICDHRISDHTTNCIGPGRCVVSLVGVWWVVGLVGVWWPQWECGGPGGCMVGLMGVLVGLVGVW